MGISVVINLADIDQSSDVTGYTNSISIQVEILEATKDANDVDFETDDVDINNFIFDENKIYNNHSIIINDEIDESDIIEINKDSHVILNDSIIMKKKTEKENNKLAKRLSYIEGIVLGKNEIRLININGYKLSIPLASGMSI
jgi:hypothetical protein